MLLVFGGLPCVGKSSIAARVASHLGATYLCVDVIENALLQLSQSNVRAWGYHIAKAVASSNLACGLSVVANSVNPVAASRDAWRHVATSNAAVILEVELRCCEVARFSHNRGGRIRRS